MKPGLCSHDSVLPSALPQDVFSDPAFQSSSCTYMSLNENRGKGTEEILKNETSGLLRRTELLV